MVDSKINVDYQAILNRIYSDFTLIVRSSWFNDNTDQELLVLIGKLSDQLYNLPNLSLESNQFHLELNSYIWYVKYIVEEGNLSLEAKSIYKAELSFFYKNNLLYGGK